MDGETFSKKNVLDEYEMGGQLGSGSFSTVFQAVERATKKMYAVKVINKRGIRIEKLAREVAVMRKVSYDEFKKYVCFCFFVFNCLFVCYCFFAEILAFFFLKDKWLMQDNFD